MGSKSTKGKLATVRRTRSGIRDSRKVGKSTKSHHCMMVLGSRWMTPTMKRMIDGDGDKVREFGKTMELTSGNDDENPDESHSWRGKLSKVLIFSCHHRVDDFDDPFRRLPFSSGTTRLLSWLERPW